MSLNGEISDRFPEPIPTTKITTTARIDIESESGGTRSIYQLPKSPIVALREVEAIVDGVERELAVGDEVTAIDATDDDAIDSVEFIGPTPDVGTTATVSYDIVPIVARYSRTYTADIDSVGDDLDQVIANKSIETATGDALDRIGTQFGRFGNRSARSDSVYRSYLRSVIPSFAASGTIADIRFAVSAATGVPESDIRVVEHTDDVEISVVIESDTAVDASAELSSIIEETLPPGIALRSDPIVRSSFVIAGLSFPNLSDAVNQGLASSTINTESLGSLDGYQAFGI